MVEEAVSNSVLEVKLDYLQKDITAIRVDVKEMKSDVIFRREFNEAMVTLRKEHEASLTLRDDRIEALEKAKTRTAGILWAIAGSIGLIFLNAAAKLFLKQP
jgi:3-dehydroquinate dehydratase